MATLPETPAEEAPARRARWPWVLGGFAAILLLLAAVVPATLWYLSNTADGRAFVARQVAGVSLRSGLRFKVARIDGSLLDRFSLVGVEVYDLDGLLLTAPRVDVDWQPRQLLGNSLTIREVAINRLTVPEARMLRMWRINPTPPDEPLLPDFDIRVGRFDVGRFALDRPVVGTPAVLRAGGNIDIRDGRVLMKLDAASDKADRLALLLDTEPDRDRFDADVKLSAPVGGVVTTLAGLDRPLGVTLDGQGGFTDWRGRLVATLGGRQAADLAVSQARNRWRVNGAVNPQAVLTGEPARLLGPAVQVDLDATVADRAVDARFAATAPLLRLIGRGGFDIDANEYRNVAVDLSLPRPAALAPGLTGRDVRASLRLNGPRATPAFNLDASAAAIAYSGRGAEGLRVVANGRLADLNRLTIPVTVTAGRVTGLPEAVSGLAQRPRFTATLSYANGVLSSRDARLATAGASAAGRFSYAQATGRYTATLDALVNDYAVPQLGRVRAEARLAVASTRAGTPAVNGTVNARALSLANAGARDFLGGLPSVTGAFATGPDGIIRFRNGRLQAPKLQLADARGSFNPATGVIDFATSGNSAEYGPLTLTAAGTLARPRATLALARPGFGVGLTDLVAEITPTDTGFAVAATGQSPQGPLAGRVRLTLGRGPLTADIDAFSFAGLNATGRVQATAAGPFAGRLAVTGRGVDADVALRAQGALQAADVAARFNGARLPLTPAVQIAQGSADVTVLLAPGAPAVRGRFDLRGVRRGELVLTRATGRADIAGQTGNAQARLAGRQGDGPAFTADVGLTAFAAGYRIALDGRLGDLPLRLAQPAELLRVPGGFELRPARLLLPRGQVDVQGRFAEATTLRAQLRDVDLSIAQLANPELRLGGRVSGGVDLAIRDGAALPVGAARLQIRGLTRAGLTTVSPPVDVDAAVDAGGQSILVGATLATRGVALGRARVAIAPGPGGTPTERLMAGAISGGIRYNGPAEALWALAGIDGQELRGGLAIGADVSGTPADPTVTGVARGRNLTYVNALTGTTLGELQLDSRFTGTRFELVSLTGRAGGGTLAASGAADLSAAARSVDIRGRLENAQLANSDLIQATVTGPINLTGQGNRFTLGGDLDLRQARVRVSRTQAAEIPTIPVRRRGEVRAPDAERPLGLSALTLDVRVRADNNVLVEGLGLDSEWRADLRVRGNPAAPALTGQAQVVRGSFEFAGNEFELNRGRVIFNGAPLESALDIQATTRTQNITATVTIGGTASKPEVAFGSIPALPQDEVLSRLLFGTSVTDLSIAEAVQLASAVASLQGGGGGFDPIGGLRRAAGIDRLKLQGADQATGRGPSIAIGKRLGRNVYVEVTTDSQGNAATQIQLALSRVFSVLAQVGSFGQNSVNARYSRDY